jgi:type I restriction enzyme R subunit
MPADLMSHDVARAFYGLTVEVLSNKLSDRGIAKTISTACSLKIDEIIRKLVLDGNKPIVDWNIKTSITGKILIEIGDYLIDEVRDKYNLELSFDEMDELAEKCIEVAKVRYKG